MSNVLVTGGAGFIGSHVCDLLKAQGHDVLAVDDLSTGSRNNLDRSIGFIQMDIRSADLKPLMDDARVEVVMHLAAQSGVPVSVVDPVKDASINVAGSVNVLEAAAKAGVRKVVYAASGGTLYGSPPKLPVTEDMAAGAIPTTPYGISKKVVEHYLLYFRSEFGTDFTQIALANIYGPRQDPLGEGGVIAIFAKLMLEGRQPTIYGDGEQTRDFVYVSDVARAFVAAIDKGSGRLINIGTGKQTSVNQIYAAMAEATGYAGEPIQAPARPEERHNALDNSLAAQLLSWQPEVELEAGLAATVEHVRGD